MRRYKFTKQYTWNPELAYLAGLVASDGCMSKDGRHMVVTSKDTEILEIAMNILGIRPKIKQKIGGFGTIGYDLQFSNVALYDFFYNAGLHPAKSKTISKILIPNCYYADFLRGEFDGDGSVIGFWDKRWRSSFMYYVSFCSASDPFLSWLQKTNTTLAFTTNGSIHKGTRANNLSYAKSDSLKLFNFMYYSSHVPSLTRKRVKFVDFINMTPYNSVS
jgi:LAGLIDADG-like domain